MEVKFDIVRPNLYIVGDEVYFGIKRQDVIPVGRTVDEIIGKHIGVLKVNESDLELVELRRPVTTKENCSVALTKYLDVIEGRYELGEFKGITSNEAKLFDLGYVLAAQTIEEGGEDLNDWIALQRNLNNPDEFFDEYEKSNSVLRLDRERTLGEMKKLYKKLDADMPDNYAIFVIIDGKTMQQNFGMVDFLQLKAKDKTKIEKAKADLVERLKEVEGPCLSFDAPGLYEQFTRLYDDAPKLIREYGDILRNPMWRKRLFKLDP